MVGRYQGLSRRWVYEMWICVDACFKAPGSCEAHLLLQLVSKKGEVVPVVCSHDSRAILTQEKIDR